MKCPDCGAPRMQVIESRSDRDNAHYRNDPGTVFRRRRCPQCQSVHVTIEMLKTEVDQIAEKRVRQEVRKALASHDQTVNELLDAVLRLRGLSK